MPNFQDLPDELVLKILSYSETKDLISCGQLSRRIRQISHDSTLWVTANLEKKIVKTQLLEMILGKGCKILNLSNSTIVGSLRRNMISHLKVLKMADVSVCPDMACPGPLCSEHCLGNIEVLEELLFSCRSLQHLEMEGVHLTPEMADSICKNAQTLQMLSLNDPLIDESYEYTLIQKIIRCCQELKEVDLGYT